MHADVEAVLALQLEDDVLDGIVAQLDAMAPRLAALDATRDKAVRSLAQHKGSIDQDERRRSELNQRLADHKQRHEKNVAQLDVVKRMREATAAVSQVEMGRKILLELEGEIRDLTTRIGESRKAYDAQEVAIASIEAEQAETRARFASERAALEGSLAKARVKRNAVADRVSSSVRVRYDKIRARRRSQSLFAVVSGACSCCDTAVPVQRRNAMSSTRAIEVCEGCGVLIYATE